ncbi:MAG: ABC transporter ATP-binding protein [Pseudomonadota bacterium]
MTANPPTGIPGGDTLRVSGLEVRYGDLVGVADVSLEVKQGTVVALLGSNGAGKTTTLNAIAGWSSRAAARSSGAARISAGCRPTRSCRAAWRCRPRAGICSSGQTVEQNLRLGTTTLADKTRVPALFDKVYAIFPRLAERRKQRAGTLSGGERQMLAMGRALMSEPRLLLLDEPSLGLAPAIVDTLYETLERLHRDGLTLLLAEQSVSLALEVADHAYVLQTGRTVLDGSAAALQHDPQVQEIYLGTKAKPLMEH